MSKRRDNSIDALPEDLRADVRRMLAGRDGRFSYKQIVEHVHEKSKGKRAVTISSLARYYQAVITEEIATAERHARFRVDLAESITKAANAATPEDREAVVLNVIDGALLTLETDPSMSDPTKLFDARAKNIRADVERGKLALARERHAGEYARLKRELAEARNEIKALRAGASSDASGPSPAELFLAAARAVIVMLKGYGDLRPLLQKYDGNIAKRLAVESERFDPAAMTADRASPVPTPEAAHG